MENEKYLTEQIITYIGNKRKLLNEISEEVEDILFQLKMEKAKIKAAIILLYLSNNIFHSKS